METTVTITRGQTRIELVVSYGVSGQDAPATWDSPAEEVEVDLHEGRLVYANDVMDLLTKAEVSAIEEACRRDSRKRHDEDLCDRYDEAA